MTIRSRTSKSGAAFATCGLIALVVASHAAPLPKTAARTHPTVTFAHDIAPIVYANCTNCHHDGSVAPFSLSSYAEVKQFAPTIDVVTQSRYMPPWKAAPDNGALIGERGLTTEQIALIHTWVVEGAPMGDPKQLAPPPHYAGGWALGPPDAVLSPSAPYPLDAGGGDVYRCFVIPTNYPTDRYLRGVDIAPGNGRIVHHIILYLDTNGIARTLTDKDGKPGYTSFGGPGFPPSGALGGWAPGETASFLPDGDGILLPKGADIVMQVHYHKDGKPESDLSKVALYFNKAPVDKRVRYMMVVNPLLRIPPGDANYEADGQLILPADVHVLAIFPHMHLLGHDMTIAEAAPGASPMNLLSIHDWDFNWQGWYTFKNPVALPAGAKITLVSHYDNSAENVRNPNAPPKLVSWGEQTTDEMCIAFLSYTVDAEHLTQGAAVDDDKAFAAASRRGVVATLFAKYDANGDGKLEPDELTHFIDDMRYLIPASDPMLSQMSSAQLAKTAGAFFGGSADGALDVDEFAKLLRAMQHGGI